MTRERAVAILNDFIKDCPSEDWEQALQMAKNSCEKLGEIEQIIKQGGAAQSDFEVIMKIRKVLESEEE